MHRTLEDAVFALKVKKSGKSKVELMREVLVQGIKQQKPTFTERHDRMIEQIPIWKDKAVQTREKDALSSHLLSQGWTEQALIDISPDRAASEYGNWKNNIRQQRVDDAATQAEAGVRRECHGGAPPEKVAAAMLRKLSVV
jgi:hypothetical protein